MSDPLIGYSKQPQSDERSRHEARCLDAVQGHGVVPLKGVSDRSELVLAEAECSLADVLHERGPLPESEVRAVGAAAAAALARVHGAGLVHADMKPANLLLSRAGELWLADFDSACEADGRLLRRSSPDRLPPGAPARPAADIAALALALVELSTGTLLDPCVSWRAADLRRMGCSPTLSTEIAFMLNGDGSTLCAQHTAEMFGRGGPGSLPAPAASTRGFDPTPTVEFMPARPAPPDSSARSALASGEPPTRWWQRLAASWSPSGATQRAAGRFRTGGQASGSSQASRSS